MECIRPDDLILAGERLRLTPGFVPECGGPAKPDGPCGGPVRTGGCGKYLLWEACQESAGKLAWQASPEMNADVAVRCLTCGVLYCPRCARQHFDNAGDEKDRQILRLEKSLSDASAEYIRLARETPRERELKEIVMFLNDTFEGSAR